jgi:hypothetical protein
MITGHEYSFSKLNSGIREGKEVCAICLCNLYFVVQFAQHHAVFTPRSDDTVSLFCNLK